MKIGIDARFVGPQGTGLGKYTEKLIENLQKIDNKNDYVIFLKKDNWDYLKFLNKNFEKHLADIPWYSATEQLKLPAILNSAKLDLLHTPHFNAPIFYKGKFVVTIHDLIHHQFSETSATARNTLVFKGKRLAYRFVISNAIKKSQKIFVPSKFVKSQVLQHYKVPESKIVVTYEAAEEEYFSSSGHSEQSEESILKKYSIKKPFIIYVGNAYPHKNLERLLAAYKILLSRNPTIPESLNLVIVCARDIFASRVEEKIRNLKLVDKVKLTGFISSKELPVIFNTAMVYVFPTLSEGFGIPGLNAMAAGLPVVCSNIPTLKEIYKDSATYFNPNDPDDIARKTIAVLSSKNLAELKIKGKKLAKNYSWEKMARETLKVYEECK